MTLFWKSIAGIFLAVFMGLAVGKQEKGLGILLTTAACIMSAMAALYILSPVIDLVRRIQSIGEISEGIISILLKALGVGILTEIAEAVCHDAGNGALAKTVQILGGATVFWLSIPIWESLITILQQILEKL